MKPNTGTGWWSALASLLLFAGNLAAGPMGSAFTYQGQLSAGGGPANGSYDLQFALFDASSSTNQIGATLTNAATPVINGLFTVTLDFGDGIFTGASRWLDISVRANTNDAFVPLSPRQPILPVPYALMAASSSGTISGNGIGLTNLSASQLATGIVPDSRLSANVPLLNGTNLFTRTNIFAGVTLLTNSGNVLRGTFSGNGAGLTNLTMPAANLTGIVPLAQLPPAVVTNNENGVSLSGTFSGNGAGLTNVSGGFKWQVVTASVQQAQPNAGYIASSPTVVNIALPTSPAIGDIVRITGAGAGGWQLAQFPGQSVLAINLGAAGATWTPRAGTLNWRCIASSSDGTKLIAGVDGGSLYTSTDSGSNWTARAGTGPWYSVASSADGTKLVAGVNNGQIFTSPDSGASWTARSVSGQWYSIASSSDGTKLVAVSLNGYIYTSTTSGVNWSLHDSPRQWYSVASSSDGTKLAAVVYGGLIYTSTNSGQTWTPRDSVRYWNSVASSGDGTKLVATALSGQIYTSTDSGVTWAPRDSTQQWWSVASSSDGTKLVAVVNNGQIYTSTDSGGTWSPRDANRNWYSVASSSDGSKLVAVVYTGQIYTSARTSTTPGATGYLFGGQNTALELQYIGNGQFLPLSHEGSFFVY